MLFPTLSHENVMCFCIVLLPCSPGKLDLASHCEEAQTAYVETRVGREWVPEPSSPAELLANSQLTANSYSAMGVSHLENRLSIPQKVPS